STYRDREREHRAHAHLARDPDSPPVQLDELATEGEPQPGALHLLLGRPDLPKLLEHRLLILRGDANPGIADRDLDQPVLWRGRNLDPPTLRRERDGVGQQVEDDLTDLPLVRLNLAQPL